MPSALGARLLLFGAAFLFSTGGVAIKATTLPVWQVASLRSAIAVIALLVFLPSARPPWSGGVLLVGLAQGTTHVLFVLSNKLTTAAHAVFLQSTAPLYVLVLSPLLLRERIRPRDVGLVVVLAAGMGLFLVDAPAVSATAVNPFVGNGLAALSGLTWAFTIMGLRRLGARGVVATAAVQAAAAGNLAAALGTLPLALPFASMSGADLAIVGFLGLFQIALAYTLLSIGVRRVPTFEASVLLLLEPILGPLWAFLGHGETPSRWAITGATLVLAATLVKSLFETRSARSGTQDREDLVAL